MARSVRTDFARSGGGCEARKIPAEGGVFFLDFSLYRTSRDLAALAGPSFLTLLQRRWPAQSFLLSLWKSYSYCCKGSNASRSPREVVASRRMDFDHSLLRTRSVFQSCYKFMPARFVIAGWFAVRGGIHWTVSLTKNSSRNTFRGAVRSEER